MSNIRFGSQLFSLRAYTKTPQDVESTFRRVREMGIDVVQISAICEMPAKEIKRIAEDNGITICSTHSPYKRIVEDLDALAEEHLLYNCKQIGIGSMPLEFRKNRDTVLKFCDILNTASEKLSGYGIHMAYHNHNFEFAQDGGEVLFDTMIKNTLPEVQFILDTYWVHFAKHDVLEYIGKLNGRLEVVHLKDYRRALGFMPIMCELGRGKLDFPAYIQAFEKAGTEFAVIEQDISKNPFKSLEISWKYLEAFRSPLITSN